MAPSAPPAALRIAGKVIRPPPVLIRVDGRDIEAHPGESLAAALWAAGIRRLRPAPGGQEMRGPFCFLGACQECVLTVDGRRVASCREQVRAGMDVTTGEPG